MENLKQINGKIAVVIVAMLLVSSTLMLFSFSTGTPTVSAVDYGDVMQYEWTQLGGGAGWNLFSAGPAPDRPEVLWTTQVSGLSAGFAGTVTAFGGKVFALTSTSVRAFDPFTGQELWSYVRTGANFQSSPTKIDDTYMFVDGDSGAGGLGIGTTANTITNATVTVLRTSDGSFVSNFTIVGVGFQPGAGGYFPGRYDPETRMKYVRGYNAQTDECSYYAINLTDPVHPSLGWKTVLDESGEELSAGGGIIIVGTVNGAILAFNGTTGEVIWRAMKVGFAQYTATYVDGMFIQGSASTTLTAYNATTGEVIWDKEQGGRAFFAFAGATAYGRFYQHNIAVPEGYVACWDIKTGDMLWKQPALYNIGYITPCVADGKVYIQRYVGTAAGVPAEVNTFSCFDAFTGDIIWEVEGISVVHPVVAYGNLYLIIGNNVCCYSTASAKDWSMWRGNIDKPGYGTLGPKDISTPKWAFKTDGAVISSAAAVNGKLYFGSQGRNIYCLDAHTGTKIWNFTLGNRVYSSPAVAGGKVFTGADDGNIYALDANSGEQLWKTAAGGITTFVFAATWQPRSSPIIVGDRLYVGALDGKLYCLNTGNGAVQWAYQASNSSFPIAGSAAYANGTVYISSTDHYLYALDANNGALVWKTRSNATLARAYTNWFPWSTPVVAEGVVYWGAGPVYGQLSIFALNQTNGRQIWVRNLSGNTPPCQTPVFVRWNHTFAGLLISEFMGAALLNASSGTTVWRQFVGHEVYSSVAYNPGVRSSISPYYNSTGWQEPTFYVGSDTYAITAFNATAAFNNATTNPVLSRYITRSHVQASPTIYDGNLYVGSADGYMYMFNDVSTASDFTVYAAASKTGEMWNNETLTVAGKLTPSIPNATIILSVNKPDLSAQNYTTTADNMGNFQLSFQPNTVGDWGWAAYYPGEQKTYIIYPAVYTEFNSIKVTAPPSGGITPTPTPTPPAEGTPVEYIYAAVAIIVIVLIAIGAYAYTKRTKK